MGRPTVEQRLGNSARMAAAEVERQEGRAEKALAEAAVARRRLDGIHREAVARFGRAIPFDPQLLDVLDSITVEAGDRWRWKGMRNNHGLPTVRRFGGETIERSLVRYLAIAFGVIGPDDHGSLYPAHGDADDVNPWHRRLRRADAPTGNPDRYQATAS